MNRNRLILVFGLLLLTAAPLWGQVRHPELQKGIALYKSEDRLEALSHLLNFLNSQQGSPRDLVEANQYIGILFSESDLPDKALEYLLDAQKQEVEDRSLKIALADLTADQYLALREPERARSYYRELILLQDGQPVDQLVTYQKIADSFETEMIPKPDSTLFYNQKILNLSKTANSVDGRIKAHNNLGAFFHSQRNYKKSLEHFNWSLALAKEAGKTLLVGTILQNQAIVLNNKGQQTRAIRKMEEARPYVFKAGNNSDKADYYNRIASLYYKTQDLYRAELYNDSALAFATKNNDPANLAEAYELAADIKNYYSDYKSENEYREKIKKLQDSLKYSLSSQAQLELLNAMEMERTAGNTLIAIRDKDLAEKRAEQAEQAQRIAEQSQQLEKARADRAAQQIIISNRDRRIALEQLKIAEQTRELLAQEKETDSINATLEQERLENEAIEQQAKLDRSLAEKAVEERKAAETQVKLEESKRLQLLGFSGLLVILLLVALGSLVYIRRANRQLRARNEEIKQNRAIIAAEKAKSDDLLLNILPAMIADELKSSGAAAPQHYDQVSVLFADIKGFTRIAEKMTPNELVNQLDLYFRQFDDIVGRYGLEKIKTIGDAYMCAGGIPKENDTNPADTVGAALAMVEFMDNMQIGSGEDSWSLRIGIHTGPVVAGVVGKNKFAYDIWGDAVNTASRMESSGEPGRVNISEDTYHLVKDRFNCSFRGEIEAKNKGKIAMYFVDGYRD